MTGLAAIRALIFDLGGVLIEVRMEDVPQQWAEATGADAADVERVYRSDTEYRRLERGEITFQQYHRHIVDRIGRPMSYEQFADGWCDVFGPVLPGVEAMLESLDGSLRLVCLSNTNVVHTEVWRAKYRDLIGRFEHVFVSHDMGARKPEPACYRQVLDYLALPPRHVAFIDDKPENVDAAAALGMRGIVATDAGQIAADLARLGAKLMQEENPT
jgi:HAD superfamily hydrolase (TIGR01509 family)